MKHPCKESFLVTFLVSIFVNFHNGGKCHKHPKCSKLHYEPLLVPNKIHPCVPDEMKITHFHHHSHLAY